MGLACSTQGFRALPVHKYEARSEFSCILSLHIPVFGFSVAFDSPHLQPPGAVLPATQVDGTRSATLKGILGDLRSDGQLEFADEAPVVLVLSDPPFSWGKMASAIFGQPPFGWHYIYIYRGRQEAIQMNKTVGGFPFPVGRMRRHAGRWIVLPEGDTQSCCAIIARRAALFWACKPSHPFHRGQLLHFSTVVRSVHIQRQAPCPLNEACSSGLFVFFSTQIGAGVARSGSALRFRKDSGRVPGFLLGISPWLIIRIYLDPSCTKYSFEIYSGCARRLVLSEEWLGWCPNSVVKPSRINDGLKLQCHELHSSLQDDGTRSATLGILGDLDSGSKLRGEFAEALGVVQLFIP